jgi:hypothetical protein
VFGNRVLRKIFGLEKEEVIDDWKNFAMKSFIIYRFHQTMLGQ